MSLSEMCITPSPLVLGASALDTSTVLVGYLALFAAVGFAFVFVNLLIGYFLRPNNDHPEKREIYECGEPTIGSSFVQFDLRFYVVALIFIVFDVEVAFLFPCATVIGKAARLADPQVALVEAPPATEAPGFNEYGVGLLRELGLRPPLVVPGDASAAAAAPSGVREAGQMLLYLAGAEVFVFFVILLVGFAYEWKTGALDWVRALVEQHRAQAGGQAAAAERPREAALSA